MARKQREWYENACYHVMGRGNRRAAIFKSDGNLGACHNEQSVNICSRWLTGIFFESIIHIIENGNDI